MVSGTTRSTHAPNLLSDQLVPDRALSGRANMERCWPCGTECAGASGGNCPTSSTVEFGNACARLPLSKPCDLAGESRSVGSKSAFAFNVHHRLIMNQVFRPERLALLALLLVLDTF